MSSYDYRLDPEGKYLFNVMKPIAPVMGVSISNIFSHVLTITNWVQEPNFHIMLWGLLALLMAVMAT